jgi:mRNA-degrading endonuclease RelE of RelBE toxin-antitoxin system
MAVVLITPEAQRQFDELPNVIRARLEKVFARLESWPNVSGAKPLRGTLAGHYRVRTGDYRVQFRVQRGVAPEADVVTVEKVGHRDRFYGE